MCQQTPVGTVCALRTHSVYLTETPFHFGCATSYKSLPHSDAHPIMVRRKAFGDKWICHSRNLLIFLLIFLLSKMGILKLVFTRTTFILQGSWSFHHFKAKHAVLCPWWPHDGRAWQTGSSRSSRCSGRKYVIWMGKKYKANSVAWWSFWETSDLG